MPQARRSHGAPLGASLTRVDKPQPESRAAKLDRLGVGRSVKVAQANMMLVQSGISLSEDDRFKVLAIIGKLLETQDAPEESWQREERAQRQAERNCVYFIRHGRHVKIGVTTTGAHQRMASMQLPPGAELVAMIPQARRDQETELHRRFAASRVRGEWFASTPELEALIATFSV